jgi:phosphoribosylformimino-5-aminoimidazole carboxamide ribotide isomerase
LLVVPAIDLLDNKAVRLFQGDYSKSKIYSESPWEIADEFISAGAELIHLVDLNGAKLGKPSNELALRKILNRPNVRFELGGGIRSLETLKFYEDLGISRFILGTAAVNDPNLTDMALERYGVDRIVLGIDAKDGFVKTQGWEKDSGIRYEDFMKQIYSQGVRQVIFTDISLDGTLNGPNFDSYSWILKNYPFQLIASGGVSSIDDLEKLSKIENNQMYGAILGKAYYEGKVVLKEAIDFCKKKAG